MRSPLLPVTCLLLIHGLLPAEVADTIVLDGNKPAAPGVPADVEQTVKRIVELTNAFRAEEGRAPLVTNELLESTAQSFAGFMAETLKYGHRADERSPADRAEEQGYEYCRVSENIAYRYDPESIQAAELAEHLVQGWKDSPPHRAGMLDEKVSEIGVAVARHPQSGTYFAVQMFGRPISEMLRFRILNKTKETLEYFLLPNTEVYSLDSRVARTHEQCTDAILQFPDLPAGNQEFEVRNGIAYSLYRRDGVLMVRERELPSEKPATSEAP